MQIANCFFLLLSVDLNSDRDVHVKVLCMGIGDETSKRDRSFLGGV